jgi:hypothetical protein
MFLKDVLDGLVAWQFEDRYAGVENAKAWLREKRGRLGVPLGEEPNQRGVSMGLRQVSLDRDVLRVKSCTRSTLEVPYALRKWHCQAMLKPVMRRICC